MAFERDLWTRFESDGIPIYVRGDRPDWFVPNAAGDRILRTFPAGGGGSDFLGRRFLDRLPQAPSLPYSGRDQVLGLDNLREIWFHLSNRCNQTCRHCLFASSPRAIESLPVRQVTALAVQAAALGCRVYVLTGGEPLLYPQFTELVDFLLLDDRHHVVVLTNGVLLRDFAAPLARWPRERFHLQVSLDGLEPNHDRLRGRGAFAALMQNLRWLQGEGRTCTLSVCVTAANLFDLPALVDLAAAVGAPNLHFLWYFVGGRGGSDRFVPPGDIFPQVVAAARRAASSAISLDNLDALKAQVFAPPGTIFDGAGSGWYSLAVGPDGRLYPSAALVGIEALATDLAPDLETAWRTSPVLSQLRRATAAHLDSPWRFFLGGGDPDHSYRHRGTWVGDDPYLPLYEKLALWLIAQEAEREPDRPQPGLRLKRGEVLETCGPHGAVALTRSNCLLTAAAPDSRRAVREFYHDAALHPRQDIQNPVGYPEEIMAHIPQAARHRHYGCGSPVLDAGLRPGEAVLDLGCGAGVECFIAARLVGPGGRVTGLDMLPTMLAVALRGAPAVTANLGYDNLEFKQGFLEDLPLPDDCVDVILSNCVINLSSHKRRTFREALRVLRPGGRLVVADVVTPSEPPPALRNDDTLRGECLAGALSEKDLLALLGETGFTAVRLLNRFPYRQVQGHPFFSLTFEARKPAGPGEILVIYRGPLAAVVTPRGQVLPAGDIRRVNRDDLPADLGGFFVVNEAGRVTNLPRQAWGCCPAHPTWPEAPSACRPAPSGAEGSPTLPPPGAGATAAPLHPTGCLVCGAPLVYRVPDRPHRCHFCGGTFPTPAVCEGGHFVCDACHRGDALPVIHHLCQKTRETDLIALLEDFRRHPAIPRHGPAHHLLVAAIILTAYRNLGGEVTPEMFRTALRRAGAVPGGACAFWGVCGAAAGVGIAFSLILQATPLKGRERRQVQEAVQAVLKEHASLEAPRCCQRECWLALRQAAELSQTLLPLPLPAEAQLACRQCRDNPDCLESACPLRA